MQRQTLCKNGPYGNIAVISGVLCVYVLVCVCVCMCVRELCTCDTEYCVHDKLVNRIDSI